MLFGAILALFCVKYDEDAVMYLMNDLASADAEAVVIKVFSLMNKLLGLATP